MHHHLAGASLDSRDTAEAGEGGRTLQLLRIVSDYGQQRCGMVLDLETFFGFDSDSIGDFPGLTRRLDHLAGLGVNCLWSLPFYPSPNRDNGYDITDYYDVGENLGTLGD